MRSDIVCNLGLGGFPWLSHDGPSDQRDVSAAEPGEVGCPRKIPRGRRPDLARNK